MASVNNHLLRDATRNGPVLSPRTRQKSPSDGEHRRTLGRLKFANETGSGLANKANSRKCAWRLLPTTTPRNPRRRTTRRRPPRSHPTRHLHPSSHPTAAAAAAAAPSSLSPHQHRRPFLRLSPSCTSLRPSLRPFLRPSLSPRPSPRPSPIARRSHHASHTAPLPKCPVHQRHVHWQRRPRRNAPRVAKPWCSRAAR